MLWCGFILCEVISVGGFCNADVVIRGGVFTHCSYHTVTVIFVRNVASLFLLFSEGQTAAVEGRDVSLCTFKLLIFCTNYEKIIRAL